MRTGVLFIILTFLSFGTIPLGETDAESTGPTFGEERTFWSDEFDNDTLIDERTFTRIRKVLENDGP